jgi:signal transduction histidine kinase
MEKVQLDRILSNIVSNALKYTPPEGAITLKTGITANRIFASVNNTGAFIPQAELATLFDRYTRASTNRGKGGSGLGLYIVKTLVEANGGSVEIESSKEKGVTFTLYFPRT